MDVAGLTHGAIMKPNKSQSFDLGILAIKEIPEKMPDSQAFWIFRIAARCAISKYKALERERLKLAQLVLI